MIRFNRDNDYLNELFQKNNIYDLNTFFISYFTNIFLNNEIILRDQNFFSAILKILKEDYNNINMKTNKSR